MEKNPKTLIYPAGKGKKSFKFNVVSSSLVKMPLLSLLTTKSSQCFSVSLHRALDCQTGPHSAQTLVSSPLTPKENEIPGQAPTLCKRHIQCKFRC